MIGMVTLKSSKIIYVDVDDTLCLWSENNASYIPSFKHIELIKKFKLRGHTVVVWSAGGWEWAERIVKEMQLEKYVDLVCSKSDWYIDDKPSSHFMPEHNRIYLE